MPKAKTSFKINSHDREAYLIIKDIEYLGSGAYDCILEASSRGFLCKRPFGFDNDEYFLSKLGTLLSSEQGEAELMDLEADSFIRIRPGENGEFYLTGYLVEHSQVTHSIEFAFRVTAAELEQFSQQFQSMVRSNV